MPLVISIVPSLPTFSIVSAIIVPISMSPFADMVPILFRSSLFLIYKDCFFSSFNILLQAACIPFLTSATLSPYSIFNIPSLSIDLARTIEVVVPSPTSSFVWCATSCNNFAPMSSYLFFKSIDLATVTPSFVIYGGPYVLSRTTFRPLGPNVT